MKTIANKMNEAGEAWRIARAHACNSLATRYDRHICLRHNNTHFIASNSSADAIRELRWWQE
jgi:hypothetical protein